MNKPYQGLEHLLPGQPCFFWRKAPDPVRDATQSEDRAQRNRDSAKSRYHRLKKKNAKEAASVLRTNKYSEVAVSTKGAGDRSAQIRKGGVM